MEHFKTGSSCLNITQKQRARLASPSHPVICTFSPSPLFCRHIPSNHSAGPSTIVLETSFPCPPSFHYEAPHLPRKYLRSVHYKSSYESLLASEKVRACTNLRGRPAMETMTVDSNRGGRLRAETSRELWTNKSLCHYFYRRRRVNTFHNQMCTCSTYADTDSFFLLRVCICFR